jgi:hypothetical protein
MNMTQKSHGLNIPKLEAALAQATPGPWVAQGCHRGDVRVLTGTVVADRDPSPEWPVVVRPPTNDLDPQAGANAEAIVEMRSQVDQLIADARTVSTIAGLVSAVRHGGLDDEGLVNAVKELFPTDGARPTWPKDDAPSAPLPPGFRRWSEVRDEAKAKRVP